MNFDRLGTAQWADADVIAEKYPHSTGKFWLGRTLPGNAAVGAIDDRHICVVAGTRSGKGTSVLIPNLLEWPGSTVVVDPTGDTATSTAAHRANELGQKVYVLDPYQESDVDDGLRAQFNPLDMLDPESRSVVRDAERIASALVSPDENEEPWAQNGARRLITALVLYVISAPMLEGIRNLVTVRELVYRGHTRMRETWLSEGKNVQAASAFDILWSVMAAHDYSNPELKDIVAGAGEEFDRMSRSAPAQWTGVHDVALSATNFINNRDMRECLSRSDFDLSEIKSAQDGVSVYLTIPSRDKVEDFRWLRLVISQIMSHMETQRETPATGHDVLLMLDEFASLKKMDRIESGIAEIAKYNVKLCLVLQNLGQLKNTYSDGWETFLANCGTKIFFGVDDKFTREYVSELIGETEIIRTTASRSEGTISSSTTTDTRGKSESEQETKSESRSDTYKRGLLNLRDTAGLFRKLSGSANASDTEQTGSSTGSTTEESKSSGSTEGSENSSSESEQIFKRPLVTPDEVGKLFQRIDDKSHNLYPGAAIALLSNHPDPIMLRRQNYFDEEPESGEFRPYEAYEAASEKDVIKRVDRNLQWFNNAIPVDSAGKHWVNAYLKRQSFVETFSYEATHFARLSLSQVWTAVQQVEFFTNWFFGYYARDERAELPSEYGPGYQTADFHATIIQCTPDHEMVFRQNDAFFKLTLADYGPERTKLTLRCFELAESDGPLTRALVSTARRGRPYPTNDVENTRHRLVRLEHLADDLACYGQSMVGNASGYLPFEWVTWTCPAGTLRFLPIDDSSSQIKEGSSVGSGTIGYVVPDHLRDSGNSEDYFIENWFVRSYFEGTVVRIDKNDGDRVEYGDRIFLVQRNAE